MANKVRCIQLGNIAIGKSWILQTGIKRLGNILPTSTRENPNQGRVYDTGGIAPAITSGGVLYLA